MTEVEQLREALSKAHELIGRLTDRIHELEQQTKEKKR